MASNSAPSLDIGGLSSNIISDFGPILSLFGEQVAKQFMSQSMGWVDNIIFSMAPLGIITAIVGAIRIGGPGWLKAIIGRARENRAMSEVELMSSTSHEVCELWDGQNVVRIMGSPEIRELIYINKEAETPPEEPRAPEESSVSEENNVLEGDSIPEDRRPPGGENANKEDTCGLYTLDEKDYLGFLQKIPGNIVKRGYRGWKPEVTTCEGKIGQDTESATTPSKNNIRDNHWKCAPNISLNIHNHVSEWELYIVATIGTILQAAVLVYSYLSMYNPILRSKLDTSPPIAWAWYCTLVGTLSVVSGMLGCCYIIEKSTDEERYRVQGGEGYILWLQKGKTVNDQVFNSYAIFAKNKRDVVITSRRNDKLTDPNHFDSHIFGYGTTVAALLSLIGFIVQFMGLRGMHWSVSVAQIIAMIIMAILRAVVRRGLSECPYSQQLPPEHEMDWLAISFADIEGRLKHWKGSDPSRNTSQNMLEKLLRWTSYHKSETSTDLFLGRECSNWSIVTGARNNGYEPSKPVDFEISGKPYNRAQAVLDIRKRLGYLTRWPGAYSDIATSVAASIEYVMNTPRLCSSSERVFSWSMAVDVGRMMPETIEFKVMKVSGNWKADISGIDAALSLWIFSVYGSEKNSSAGGKGDARDSWLRSGKASRQQAIRLLGPSVPSSRRDMKWWIGDGLGKVIEVDLSKPDTAVFDSTITIKSDDRRVLGFGGGRLDDGVYNTRPLSETPIGGVLNQEVINHILLYINTWSNCEDKQNTKTPLLSDLGTKEALKSCLAVVSEAPLGLLFAQEMFSAFMWAFSESPNSNRIDGQTIVQPQSEQSSRSDTAWKSFTLRNSTLSKLAQSIEGTGLGNLDEVYMSIIPPLSAHGRLPDVGVVVDHIHEQTKKYQVNGYWENAAKMYLWVFLECSHVIPGLRYISGPAPTASIKATAVFMEFLRALAVEVERYEKQQCTRAEEISRSLEKLRSESALNLCGSDKTLFRNLAWLYMGQHRGVNWEPLVAGNEIPHDTYACDQTALGLDLNHQKFLQKGHEPVPHDPIGDEDSVDKLDMLGWTSLHYAVSKESCWECGTVERLGKAGDWRVGDLWEWTPLHYAAANPKFNPDWTPLKEKADINMQGRDGFSPLHCAAMSGNFQMARKLVESGANLQMFDNSRKTPLHWAAYYGHEKLVSLMLVYGAIPVATDEFGRTPLHLAALRRFTKSVEIMVKVMGEMIDARDRDGLTPMQMAASNGCSEMVKTFLEHGADANTKVGMYGSVLLEAVKRGYEDVVELLVEHGADINAQGDYGGDALKTAIRSGHLKVVKVLLKHGADINTQDDYGRDALQTAVRSRHPKVVKILLEHGADANVQDGYYGSPLQEAASEGQYKIVRVLLEHGMDPNTPDYFRGGALQAAARRGHHQTIKVLLGHGADVNGQGSPCGNVLQAATKEGHHKVAKFLLEHKADVNAQCGIYANALQMAAAHGYHETVKMFLEHGADVGAKEGIYGNSLQAATVEGYGDIVKTLLEYRADVNAQGGPYGNALQAAAWKGHYEIAKVLLEHGADVNAQGGHCKNALQAATKKGHQEIANLLLEHGTDLDTQK